MRSKGIPLGSAAEAQANTPQSWVPAAWAAVGLDGVPCGELAVALCASDVRSMSSSDDDVARDLATLQRICEEMRAAEIVEIDRTGAAGQ